MPGTWAHLARRFFWTLGARDLTATEIDELADFLTAPELSVFLAQPEADRRHGYDAFCTVRRGTDDTDVWRAAALHDVGKRQAGLGTLGRAVASALSRLRLPTPGRLGTYLRHPELGSDELQGIGCSPLVVDFARHHHQARPTTISPATWDLLQRADTEVIGRGRIDR